jgi:hypothetical protein
MQKLKLQIKKIKIAVYVVLIAFQTHLSFENSLCRLPKTTPKIKIEKKYICQILLVRIFYFISIFDTLHLSVAYINSISSRLFRVNITNKIHWKAPL